MYLGNQQNATLQRSDAPESDTSSVALRARLLAGVTGYAAQCRALSPRTDATPHVQGASPMRQQSGGSQSMVSSVTNLSIGEPLVEPVEAPALADAGLQAAEYRTARKRLYRETIRIMKRGRSARAKAILEKHPGISPRRFFQKYWAGKCWQYASALAYHAGLSDSRRGLMNTTKQTAKSARQHGGKAKPMQTRSVAYRGMTLAELGACSDLPVGASVHVKVQYDKDVPYHRGDDFHHWVTYLGDGKFTDSRNVSATGARLDTFLQGWVRSKLHKRMYRHLHRAPYAKRARRKAKWRPVAGLQPRVTEVFMMAQRQSEEKKAPSSHAS